MCFSSREWHLLISKKMKKEKFCLISSLTVGEHFHYPFFRCAILNYILLIFIWLYNFGLNWDYLYRFLFIFVLYHLKIKTAYLPTKSKEKIKSKLGPYTVTLLCQQRSVWTRLWFFQWSCMDVRVGRWRKLSTEKLMLLNCVAGEDSWESLGLQGDPTSPS